MCGNVAEVSGAVVTPEFLDKADDLRGAGWYCAGRLEQLMRAGAIVPKVDQLPRHVPCGRAFVTKMSATSRAEH